MSQAQNFILMENILRSPDYSEISNTQKDYAFDHHNFEIKVNNSLTIFDVKDYNIASQNKKRNTKI